MPDITMCSNHQCPLRAECRRSAASGTEPSQRQSYSHFLPQLVIKMSGIVTDCDHLMPIDPKSE